MSSDKPREGVSIKYKEPIPTPGEIISDRMLRLAGVNRDDVQDADAVPGFEEFCQAIKLVHRGKTARYGDYLESLGGDPEKLQLTQLYCEVKRKWTRFQNMMRSINAGKNVQIDELLEVLGDLAVYGILGCCLVHKHEEGYKQPGE